jgi:nickel transport protein
MHCLSLRNRVHVGLATLLCVLLVPRLALGHALLHEVIDGEAVILRFSFAGADQPWYEPYQVFAPGGEVPFQSGRLNALGELSFRPDRAGTWRVRVVTEDGHGAQLEIEVDEAGTLAAVAGGHGHAHDHWLRVLAALGYLLGAFGLLALWRSSRARSTPG